jgi:hypothetical protein
MALRNVYATAANDAGADATEAKIKRTIANKIDEYMTGNLPEADRAAFIAEKTAYDSHANLLKATGAAKQKGGYYADKEWLGTTNTQRAATGSGPNQHVADALRADSKAINTQQGVDIKATNAKAKLDADAVKTKAKTDTGLVKSKEKADADIVKAKAKVDTTAAKDKANVDVENLPEIEKAAGLNKAAAKEADAKKEAIVQRGRKAKVKAEKGLEKAREKLKDVQLAMPQAKPNVGQQLGNTAVMSTLAGAPFIAMGAPSLAIPAGITAARSLSTKGGSKFMTGQWGDEFLDAASRKSFLAPFTRGTATPPFRNPEMRLADILRQGTAAGTVQGQNE